MEKNARKAKEDLEKNSGKRDERMGMGVELFGDPGQGHDSVEVNG